MPLSLSQSLSVERTLLPLATTLTATSSGVSDWNNSDLVDSLETAANTAGANFEIALESDDKLKCV